MVDFGFIPSELMGIILEPYFPHNTSDVYDPYDRFLGNTNVRCIDGSLSLKNPNTVGIENGDGKSLDWLFTNHIDQDLRMGFLKTDSECNVSSSK